MIGYITDDLHKKSSRLKHGGQQISEQAKHILQELQSDAEDGKMN